MNLKNCFTSVAIYLFALAAFLFPNRGFGQISSYWHLNEAFSSLGGAIQFVELSTTPSTPQTLGAYYLYNERGQSFFQMSYPGGSGNQRFLIATPGFASQPGAVTPNIGYLPPGFLSPGGGSLRLRPYTLSFDSGYMGWSQLALNGSASLSPSGVNPTNSPQNHAGQIGSINLNPPSPQTPPTIICPLPLFLECTNGFAIGTIHAGVQNTNGNPLQVIWTVDGLPYETNTLPAGGGISVSNLAFSANFGGGTHLVVISASNGLTSPATCSLQSAIQLRHKSIALPFLKMFFGLRTTKSQLT